MIAGLRGNIAYRRNTELGIDVNGVIYSVFASKTILENASEGAVVGILTYMDVKETSILLYGFSDNKERELFKLLISVSGIGAKMAHTMLVNSSFEEIVSFITSGSSFGRPKIPGLGTKKLELISTTLRDKIFKLNVDSETLQSVIENAATPKDQHRLDALTALVNLGFQRAEAEKKIREVLKQNSDKDLSAEDIIRLTFEI